jgi:hypothetical protein
MEAVAACGPNSLDSLASYDRATQSWRTSQHSLFGGLDEFSETWPRSGMTRSGTAYQLQPLAPPTGEIESGLLPTPTDVGNMMAPSMQKWRSHRNLWPTPDASVAQFGEKPETWLARREEVKAKGINGNGMGMPLTIAVQMWPTPTSRDWKDGSAKACANVPANGLLGRVVHQFPTPRSSGITMGGGSNQRKAAAARGTLVTGALNPTWVEWLMGFPLEWTVCELSGTRLYRKSRKSSAGPS